MQDDRLTTRFTKDPKFKFVVSLAIMWALLSTLVLAAVLQIVAVAAGTSNSVALLVIVICVLGLITNGVTAWRNRYAFRPAPVDPGSTR